MAREAIALIYHSQSAGNTKAAAAHVREAIEKDGRFTVREFNTNDGRVDPAVLAECAGVAFGTPDYFSYPAGGLKMFIDDWLVAKRKGNEQIEGLPIALFLTHGGGGAARAPFEGLCQHVGPQVADTVMIKGHPGDEAAQACRALALQLVEEAVRFAESK
jgi:flavorubredoxin